MSQIFKYGGVAVVAFLGGLLLDRLTGLSGRGLDAAATSSPTDTSATIQEFAIEGMSCQGCVEQVTAALKSVPGVQLVQVSLPAKRAILVGDPARATWEKIAAAVRHAGYQAQEVSAAAEGGESKACPVEHPSHMEKMPSSGDK